MTQCVVSRRGVCGLGCAAVVGDVAFADKVVCFGMVGGVV